jgi:hypothetical protein
MFKKYDSKKENFIEVITHNKNILIKNGIKNLDYISLMSYFSLSEKQFNLFESLKTVNAKYGYLSRYLLSCGRKIGISQFYLTDYYQLKEQYNRYKKLYNNIKNKDDIKQFIKDTGIELINLKKYLELYKNILKFENIESKLKHDTSLLIKMIIEKFEDTNNRKSKIYNILTNDNK